MSLSAAIPAGAYYVGDPCYAFKDHGLWMKLLESAGFDQPDARILEAKVDGGDVTYSFVASGTMYGDGEYPAYGGGEYFSCPVDAGLIGVVPAEIVKDEPFGMTLVEFPEDFAVGYVESTGLITIGKLMIETGDEEE